jgi:hypothetical protein
VKGVNISKPWSITPNVKKFNKKSRVWEVLTQLQPSKALEVFIKIREII